MPANFRCTPFMGQNVLLFKYIIAYDCKNVIPQQYKLSHFDEMFSKDGKIIRIDNDLNDTKKAELDDRVKNETDMERAERL